MIKTLIVDDDPDVALLHARYVAALEGFEVAGVLQRGGPVLAFLEENQVDLVLLDVHLPDMNGLQVLEDLRGSGYDTGVVMITAASERDMVRFAVGRGIDDYLVKPFTVADFNQRLEAFRASRSQLTARVEPRLDQGDIDSMLRAGIPDRHVGVTAAPAVVEAGAAGAGAGAPSAATWTANVPLPKGFSLPTVELVGQALRGAAGRGGAGDLSASEVSESCGISRVSARRYLEMMTERGLAELRPKYGAPGRPEHRYRLVGK
ncbi:response regulator [Paeniglutamicibacter sp. NPDC012692]|uniref:response regulator n=1 Tax=Paeniglutamicibacter sp. NPDC012692 TaxID=3364388 RepID=UPI00368C79D2